MGPITTARGSRGSFRRRRHSRGARPTITPKTFFLIGRAHTRRAPKSVPTSITSDRRAAPGTSSSRGPPDLLLTATFPVISCNHGLSFSIAASVRADDRISLHFSADHDRPGADSGRHGRPLPQDWPADL